MKDLFSRFIYAILGFIFIYSSLSFKLLTAEFDDKNSDVREKAVYALYDIDNNKGIPALIEIAKNINKKKKRNPKRIIKTSKTV